MLGEKLIRQNFATITSNDYSKNINGGPGMWSANVSGLPGFRTTIKQAVRLGKHMKE